MPHSGEPPDGGWGWVIVAAVFLITFLSFGTSYSIGIVFDELIEEFGASKSEVSIIASLAFSLQCFLGPFVSLLQQKYQARRVVLVGSVLISLAFISSAFAPNLIYLYCTVGILGGIGMAMVYLPLLVLISFYFSRKRSLATALACMGGHVGAFIQPYLIRFLVSIYDWRGALFIIGALVLNSIAVSILLRPVGHKRRQTPHENAESVKEEGTLLVEKNEHNDTDTSRCLESFISENISGFKTENNNIASEVKPVEKADSKAPCELNSDVKLILDEAGDVVEMPTTSCEPGTPGVCFTTQRHDSTSSGSSLPKVRTLTRPLSFARQLSERIESSWNGSATAHRQSSVPSLDKRLGTAANGSATGPVTPNPRLNLKGSQLLLLKPAQITHGSSFNSALSSSILSIPIYAPSLAPDALFTGLSSEALNTGSLPMTRIPSRNRCEVSENEKLPEETTGEMEALETTVICATASREVSSATPAESTQNKKRQIFHAVKPFFRHFRSPGFTAFVASNFLLCLAYYTPSVFVAHWGDQLGIPKEQTTLLLSLVGMGNILGRPLLAFSADRWADYRIALFAIMVGIAGTITTITPLTPNFYFLAFFVFQFGFLAGTSQTLLTPILADMVPLSELSHAFGVLILADGIAMLIGPPLLALLPSYDLTFTVSGLIMIASSVVLIGPTYFSSQRLKANCSCNMRQSSPTSAEPVIDSPKQ